MEGKVWDNNNNSLVVMITLEDVSTSTSTSQHCHGPEPSREATRKALKRLQFGFVLCCGFFLMEIVGGYVSGSLAIMGDAAHMASDLLGFGLK